MRMPSFVQDDTSDCSDESSALDYVSECRRLDEHLKRVLADHQRQKEEIGDLQVLVKSLKEEAKTIRERQRLQIASCRDDKKELRSSRCGSHEVFKADVQIEATMEENAELRRQLDDCQEELQSVRAIAQNMAVYELAAVKANAELCCVKSQLEQERAHSDQLQRQLMRRKMRQNDKVPLRASSEPESNQDKHENDLKESDIARRERKAFLRQCMR